MSDEFERILLFCRMLQYGLGRAGIWTVGDPLAYAYNTFADIHLIFTMFLVDRGSAPIGGFIAPLLQKYQREGLLVEVRRVLDEDGGDVTFEAYLRQYRNRLATHGDLSPRSLANDVRSILVGDDHTDRVLELIDELRDAVDELAIAVQRDLDSMAARMARDVCLDA